MSVEAFEELDHVPADVTLDISVYPRLCAPTRRYPSSPLIFLNECGESHPLCIAQITGTFRGTRKQMSDIILMSLPCISTGSCDIYKLLIKSGLLRIQARRWCCAFCLEIMVSIDDVFIEVVYDVGHPWRISCVHYRAMTGVVPRQESRDPNNFKKAWSGRRRSRGPSPQNFCPSRCASEGRVLT